MALEHITPDSRIHYDEAANALIFSGRLRSVDSEIFNQLEAMLENASKINKLSMVWDLRNMQDLNSAGLGVLYRFVAKQRENPDYVLKIRANSKIYWQDHSLPNLKKLMPHVHLEYTAV